MALRLSAKLDYDDHMDPEMIDLCNAMNSIPGIRTTQSCCGHGEGPAEVYFEADSPAGLFYLSRAVSRRYWEYGVLWTIMIPDCSDIRPVPYFLLTSVSTWGDGQFGRTTDSLQIENHLQSLVATLNCHLNHKGFMEGFGMDSALFTTEEVV